jgi:hypothetical protein
MITGAHYWAGMPHLFSTLILAFQRTAARASNVLPLYGSSELVMGVPKFLDRRQITLLEKDGCFTIVPLTISFIGVSPPTDKAYLAERGRL